MMRTPQILLSVALLAGSPPAQHLEPFSSAYYGFTVKLPPSPREVPLDREMDVPKHGRVRIPSTSFVSTYEHRIVFSIQATSYPNFVLEALSPGDLTNSAVTGALNAGSKDGRTASLKSKTSIHYRGQPGIQFVLLVDSPKGHFRITGRTFLFGTRHLTLQAIEPQDGAQAPQVEQFFQSLAVDTLANE